MCSVYSGELFTVPPGEALWPLWKLHRRGVCVYKGLIDFCVFPGGPSQAICRLVRFNVLGGSVLSVVIEAVPNTWAALFLHMVILIRGLGNSADGAIFSNFRLFGPSGSS